MKISKKIALSILSASFLGLALMTGANLLCLLRAKQDLIQRQKEQSRRLYDTNVEILTDANRDTVQTFARNYGDTIEAESQAIRNNVLYLRNALEDLYARGGESSSGYDDSMYYLQPGVEYEGVADEFRSVKGIRDIMANIAAENERRAFYYVTDSGVLLSNVKAEYTAGSEIDRRTRDWYVGAKEGGGVFWTDVYRDALSGGLAITCSAPVYGPDGTFQGVVASDIPIDEMCGTILSAGADNILFTFVLNQNGEFIIGSEQGKTPEDFVSREDAEELTGIMSRRGDGAAEGDGACITSGMVAGYSFVEAAGWKVGILLDYDRIIAPAKDTGDAILRSNQVLLSSINDNIIAVLWSGAGVAAATLALVLVLSGKLGASISRPIARLTTQVELIGSGQLDQKVEYVDTGDEVSILAGTFNQMTEALQDYIRDLKNVTADKERIATELHVATRIQSSMLPCIFPAFPQREEFDIFATMEPAKEVGGDFYDFFLIDDSRLALVIADVSGKGVPAALFMVIAKTLIKNHAQAGETPADVFTRVNAQLCENNEAGMFVTAWMGILETDTGILTYVNAGHNPPLMKKADGEFEYLRGRPGFVLAGLEDIVYSQSRMKLEAGDVLYLYTDGVTEATDSGDWLYGEERLRQALNQNAEEPLETMLKNVKRDIGQFVGEAPQFDDITMLALKIRQSFL